VIHSGTISGDNVLAGKGQTTTVCHKIQISSDFVKSGLEGKVHFDVEKSSGSRSSKSESFSLPVSHLDLLVPLKDGLADLLSQGVLTACMSKRKTLTEMRKFKHVLKAVNRHSGFGIAEEMEESAFLGANFIGKHPVALLLKFSSEEGKLAVDGKASDQDTLAKVMKDFSDILS